jgi:hypothetical protein
MKTNTMKATIKYCLQHLLIQIGDDTVSSEIYQNEFNQWVLKIKYPKVERSHYYSMVHMMNELFAEQYPYWAKKLNH